MNYLAILSFCVYVVLAFVTGIGLFAFLDTKDKLMEQRSLFLGEILLLGSIFIVGELVTLSLTKYYYGVNLWILTFSNLLFLGRYKTREYIKWFFNRKFTFHPAFFIFIVFFLIFTFRNCFPLMDNDSHSSYLWMPKLWLLKHTSIFSDVLDGRAYVPHLEAVPYGLGIALFNGETLFPGLINLFWRWTALLIVFGYTSYRFNQYYGLAASLFVLLNEHFFYSGVNYPVLLNGAIIAFIFAAVYNFWESREKNSSFRLMLSIIFLSQIIGTKLNMAFVVVLLFIFMVVTQKNRITLFKDILQKHYLNRYQRH